MSTALITFDFKNYQNCTGNIVNINVKNIMTANVLSINEYLNLEKNVVVFGFYATRETKLRKYHSELLSILTLFNYKIVNSKKHQKKIGVSDYPFKFNDEILNLADKIIEKEKDIFKLTSTSSEPNYH